MCCTMAMNPPKHGLQLVAYNLIILREGGLYEEALLEAFTDTEVNWRNERPEILRGLLELGDRE
jgi:hypothetical protein